MNTEFALEVSHLTKNYRDFSLNDVSFSLPTGCIMGFIGENGAGKTTTIRSILGMIQKKEGTINILGASQNECLPKINEHLGIVLNECTFPETLTTSDVSTIMKHIYKTWNNTSFSNYMDRFALPKKKKIKDFSTGMKTKLSIAAALSHDSRLLILDEATSGLDPIAREEILDVFLEFIQDENHSVFMSSHIVSDLEKICDYITFLHKGKILFSESKDVLLDSYGIYKCSKEEFDKLDASCVKAIRENKFGIEALVSYNQVKRQMSASSSSCMDRASIEEIMLMLVKGKQCTA